MAVVGATSIVVVVGVESIVSFLWAALATRPFPWGGVGVVLVMGAGRVEVLRLVTVRRTFDDGQQQRGHGLDTFLGNVGRGGGDFEGKGDHCRWPSAPSPA
jgi:hypothetical protein